MDAGAKSLWDMGMTTEVGFQVAGFMGPREIVERLQELGIYPQAPVEFIEQMPFGGPRVYRVGSLVLSLRKSEAECIKVESTSAGNGGITDHGDEREAGSGS